MEYTLMDANTEPLEGNVGGVFPDSVASLSFAACTDVGLVRSTNEDAFGWYQTANGPLVIVCDGMGGHSRGKLAARTALGEIRRYVNTEYVDDAKLVLKEAIRHANQVIATMNHNKIEYSRMGTTVVAALWRGSELHYAHVGDSRLYVLREGVLHQLTMDHTYVQQLVDGGIINAEDARHHPDRSRLTQAVGVEYNVKVSTATEPLICLPGDILVSCTDGLTEMLTDREIADMIAQYSSLQEACDQLIEAAKLNGGQDNITVVLTRINPTT